MIQHTHKMTDSLASAATALALGSAAAGTVAPHPLQIAAWCVSITAGLGATIYWIRKNRRMR